MRISDDPRRLALANYPFVHPIRARYSDCDTNGHVNNVAIAAWYEASTVELTMARIRPGGGWLPALVASVSIDYLADVAFPGDYQVGVGLVALGRTSFTIGCGLFRDERCLGLGNRTLVQMVEGRPAPISDALRERWLTVRFWRGGKD